MLPDKEDLKKLSVEELAFFLSPSSDVVKELKSRGVLRTKNIVGELGEYYAIKLYNKIDNNFFEYAKKLQIYCLPAKQQKM